jgi:hypothetical protein
MYGHRFRRERCPFRSYRGISKKTVTALLRHFFGRPSGYLGRSWTRSRTTGPKVLVVIFPGGVLVHPLVFLLEAFPSGYTKVVTFALHTAGLSLTLSDSVRSEFEPGNSDFNSESNEAT